MDIVHLSTKDLMHTHTYIFITMYLYKGFTGDFSRYLYTSSLFVWVVSLESKIIIMVGNDFTWSVDQYHLVRTSESIFIFLNPEKPFYQQDPGTVSSIFYLRLVEQCSLSLLQIFFFCFFFYPSIVCVLGRTPPRMTGLDSVKSVVLLIPVIS